MKSGRSHGKHRTEIVRRETQHFINTFMSLEDEEKDDDIEKLPRRMLINRNANLFEGTRNIALDPPS